jgi:hypothetical protein
MTGKVEMFKRMLAASMIVGAMLIAAGCTPAVVGASGDDQGGDASTGVDSGDTTSGEDGDSQGENDNNQGDSVDFDGTITAIDGNNVTIDGVTVQVPDELLAGLAVGMQVKVSATYDADGNLVVVSVEVSSEDDQGENNDDQGEDVETPEPAEVETPEPTEVEDDQGENDDSQDDNDNQGEDDNGGGDNGGDGL